MGCDVTHGGGLAGGVGGVPWGSGQVSRGRIRVAARRARFPPRDLAPRPGTPELDRSSGSIVSRSFLLEEGQHVLGAVSGPQREEMVILVPQGSAATHGDEPRVPDLGKYQVVALDFGPLAGSVLCAWAL